MLYDITVNASVNVGSNHRLVEAKDEAEAEAIAKGLRAEKKEEITLAMIGVSSYVSLSDKNFLYDKDAMYLIRRYSKYQPAKCISSGHPYRRSRYSYSKNFEHIFELFDTHKRVTFRGKNPSRIIRKLCDKGEIGKPECNDCPAKFICYTKR